MKYIGMINFKTDEYEVTTATTVEEAKDYPKCRLRLRDRKAWNNAVQKTQTI